jgi:hypothetical protein
MYALFFIAIPDADASWIDPHMYQLVFVPSAGRVDPEIIRADDDLEPPDKLLMEADLAWDGKP